MLLESHYLGQMTVQHNALNILPRVLSIDGVGFRMWRHTFKMAAMTSFREKSLAHRVWRHWLMYLRYLIH